MAASTFFIPEAADRIKDQKMSIWTEFISLAAEYKPVNLGQGFPDSPAPKFVTNILEKIAQRPELTSCHQYTRGYGHPELVAILAEMYSTLYGRKVDPKDDVLITVGAYLALYYAFLGWLNKGDEVLIIEPAFDCYHPQISFAGGVPVSVLMKSAPNASKTSDFYIDFDELESKVTNKTKMLVLNNPHNPIGKLFNMEELEKIAAFVTKHNLIVVADEVYEFHVYDKNDMIRFASLPGMYDRTISIGSAGKAFSITGWKLGWAVGPQALLAPLKAIHQNCVFTCSTPTQQALAEAFKHDWEKFKNDPENSYLATGLGKEMKEKRDKFFKMVENSSFRPILPDAGYFMLASYKDLNKNDMFSATSEPADFVFSKWLCREKKLAVIPMTAFCSQQEDKASFVHLIRFCFFKKDETLEAAGEILNNLKI